MINQICTFILVTILILISNFELHTIQNEEIKKAVKCIIFYILALIGIIFLVFKG